jgi:hypothetical protein
MIIPLFVFGQTRSVDELFSEYDAPAKAALFTQNGIFKSIEKSSQQFFGPQLLPRFLSADTVMGPVLSSNPSFLVESLIVIPAAGYSSGLIGIYNALGKVRNLKGRLYHSATRDRDVPLFEDATRLESERRLTAIADPSPVSFVPAEAVIFMRLKDVNFGNTYYRLDITVQDRGLLCRLSNFRNITYLLIPVIKENKFIAQLYIEPVTEGILIYSAAGADVSDFVSSRVDMPSAIQKRVEVIVDWIIDGITAS